MARGKRRSNGRLKNTGNVDEVEFNYIKSILKKSRKGVTKVSEFVHRSKSCVGYVQQAKDWEDYKRITAGKKPLISTKLVTEPKKTDKAVKEAQDYSGAVFAELVRIRRSINHLDGTVLIVTIIISLFLILIFSRL